MKDYQVLKELCEDSSRLSATVIDEFIIPYADQQYKLAQEYQMYASRFWHILEKLPPGTNDYFTGQYIAYRVFREDGLIHKILRHSSMKEFNAEELHHLRLLSSTPWRFSFSIILDNPAADFYVMADVFTDEEFLLYSPTVTTMIREKSPQLWFNLIGYNGGCWETYGPVVGFPGFDSDDIFFFASEWNPSVSGEDDLLRDLNKNPVPYMMLFAGSGFPLMIMRDTEIVQVVSELNNVKGLDMMLFEKDFQVEYRSKTFKLSHGKWSAPPHYAEVFYFEPEATLLISAQTETGYKKVAELINGYGFSFPEEPDIRVHHGMLMLIEDLLKRKVVLNPYAAVF